jgi:hypothetical protein
MNRHKQCSRSNRVVVVSAFALWMIVAVACVRSNSTSVVSQKPTTSPATSANTKVNDTRTISWPEQGMTLSVPAGWQNVPVRQETDIFKLEGPNDSALVIEVNDDHRVYDVDRALQRNYDNLKEAGVVEEVRLLDLDGAKGIVSISTDIDGSKRSIHILWNGFRETKGKQQFIIFILHGLIGGPTDRKTELLGILNSLKLTKD